MKIGITERGDAALDTRWIEWVDDGKPAILITKAPSKLFKVLLDEFETFPDGIIVHCTITGMGKTRVEPGVKHWEEELEAYCALREYVNPDYHRSGIVLRIDPIIPTDPTWTWLQPFFKAAQACSPARVRISFMDGYPHVRKRGLKLRWEGMHAPLELRQERLAQLRDMFIGAIEVCGEPGLPCTGCVSAKDLKILGVSNQGSGGYQRDTCACLANKVELLKRRGQCAHQCQYCYWR